MIKPSRFIERLEAYNITPQDVWADTAPRDLLKLDWNEAPIDLSFYKKELKNIVNERGMIAWYPDYLSIKLSNELSKYLNIDSNFILTFPGSDVGLETLCRAYLDYDDTVASLSPTYENFFVYCLQTGAELKKIEIEKPFLIDEVQILRSLEEIKNLKMVYLVNPNNPCGYLISKDFITTLASSLPNTILVVDEAYIEFADCDSSVKLIEDHNNIVIFRTFSKGFGLAGMRLGYMCAPLEIINMVNKIRNGKNVSMLAQRMGIFALQNIKLVMSWLDEVKDARDFFQKWCQENKIEYYPSQGNFVLFEVKNPSEVTSKLKSVGIFIRNRDSILPGCIRITIGSKDQVKRLIRSLESMSTMLW